MKKTYYFRINYQMLDKGIRVEQGSFGFQAFSPVPTNEVKNHLRDIKFKNNLAAGVGKEFLIDYTQIEHDEFVRLNSNAFSGQ